MPLGIDPELSVVRSRAGLFINLRKIRCFQHFLQRPKVVSGVLPVLRRGQRRLRNRFRPPKRVLSMEKGTRVSGPDAVSGTNDVKRDEASSAKVGMRAAAGRGGSEMGPGIGPWTGPEAEPV
jgi:hypothetical protein